MNETTNKIIDMLQNQVQIRDETIESFKRENSTLIAVIKNTKRKYTNIALILSALLMLSTLINLYMILH